MICPRCKRRMFYDGEDAVCITCGHRAFLVSHPRPVRPRRIGRYMTVSQYAKLMAVSDPTVIKWCREGRVQGATVMTVGTYDKWFIPWPAPLPRLRMHKSERRA